ncbi:dynactin subunit 3 [Rhinoraja longicauda]
MAELKRLQDRLDRLETRLYGDRPLQAGQFVDAVAKIQSSLGTISNKRERIKTLYKKIDDLMKFLDPQYIDRIDVPDAMKLEFILAEEEFIHSQVHLLELVKKQQPYLESEHIKAVSNHSSKVQALTQVQIEEQDQCNAITEDVTKMLDEYNKMILLLSKQFIQWEEMLTKFEAAKQIKPPSD